MCFVVLLRKSRGREEDMAYCPPVHASCFACHSMCAVRVRLCTHVVLDMDGAAFSCHHIHSRSQGADKALR